MKLRKLVCLTLSVGMLVSVFSGCGKSNAGSDEAVTTAAQTTAAEEKKLEPVTFTMMNCDSGSAQNYDNFQSPVARKITELTGVTLNVEFMIGDPKQKFALMASAGSYPDFIYAADWSNIIVEAGGFVALDDYIQKSGDNIKNVYGDYLKRLRWSNEDPKIYIMGNNTVNERTIRPGFGFEIQHAVLKELGYPKIDSLKAYEDAIKAYKEKYPKINGKPTIGLSLLAEDWRIKISTTNPAAYGTGKPDDGEWYFDKKAGKAVLHLTTPEEREYFRWLNHMNDIGLLDKESFVQKYDQYQAKIADGRVLALTDSKWQYMPAETSLIKAGMPERTYAMLPIVMDPSTQKYAALRPLGFSGGYGIGITTSCKDPERAFKFLDWLASEEGQILRYWGIENEHYIIKDGKREFKPEVFKEWIGDPGFAKKSGVGLYGYPWPGYGVGAKDNNGDFYQPLFEDTIIQAYTKPEKETLDAYGVKLWKDLYPSEDNFEVNPYGELWRILLPADSEGNLIMRKYEETTARRIPEAILVKPDKFDAVWDSYQEELKSIGVEKLTEEFNKALQSKIELWK